MVFLQAKDSSCSVNSQKSSSKRHILLSRAIVVVTYFPSVVNFAVATGSWKCFLARRYVNRYGRWQCGNATPQAMFKDAWRFGSEAALLGSLCEELLYARSDLYISVLVCVWSRRSQWSLVAILDSSSPSPPPESARSESEKPRFLTILILHSPNPEPKVK